MYRDLLVHLDGREPARERLRLSLELAEAFNARLSAAHVRPPLEIARLWKPSLVDKAAAALESRLRDDAARAKDIFDTATSQRVALEVTWAEGEGDIATVLCHWARCVDLVILGQYEVQGPPEQHPFPVAHSVIVGCGRPVLVVPAQASSTRFERITIAWDGSREAVRAVHDAMPFLRRAKEVKLLTVLNAYSPQITDLPQLEAHLSRHDVQTRREALPAMVSEHQALQDAVATSPCDLIVLGGYSHPMWREFILGGASAELLVGLTTPMLVSH